MLFTAAIGPNADATGADSATFKITDAKLYVPIVALSAEDNAKLSKQLGEGFKRSVYWGKYKVIDNTVKKISAINEEKYIKSCLIQAIKESKDCLSLITKIQQMIMTLIIKFLLIISKNTFFQELK